MIIRRVPKRVRRILLIEDETAVRQMLTRVLSREGYELLVASNGREAAALSAEEIASIDLLISDLVMPGANGVDVASELRSRAPHLEVLFMSGSADHPVLDRVLAGKERFIPKPFALDEFSRLVHEALTAEDES
jgi:two-component system cell cycle sensor histidine kinase/response regulator CckA